MFLKSFVNVNFIDLGLRKLTMSAIKQKTTNANFLPYDKIWDYFLVNVFFKY